MVFIFVQSALPADISQEESGFLVPFVSNLFGISADSASFLIRKGAHFTEYTILGVSLALTVTSFVQRKDLWKGSLLAFLIGVIYAVSDEFHQTFVDGRSGELRDMAIDWGGVLLGVLILFIIKSARKKG